MRVRIKLDNGHDETTHQLFDPIIIRTRHGKTKLNTGACQPVNTHAVDPEKNKGLIWMPNGMNSLDVEKEDHITPFLEDFIYAYECALYGNMPNAFGVAPIDAIINNQSRFYINELSGNLGLLQIRPVFLYRVTRIGKGWIPRWINRQILGLEREYYINYQLTYGGKFNAEGAESPTWILQNPTKQIKGTPPQMGVIKQWITEREVTHEKKGVDAMQVRLCPAIYGSVNLEEINNLKVTTDDSFLSKMDVIQVSDPTKPK